MAGPASAVAEFTAGHDPLHREQLAGHARVTVRGSFDNGERDHARSLGLDLEPVSLQQLVVRTTAHRTATAATATEETPR